MQPRKPVAIIGTGPCLKDVTDIDALLENRWCLALNGARRHIKTQGIIFSHKRALLKHSETVDKDTHIVIVPRIEKWLPHQDHIYPDREYELFDNHTGMNRDMALPHAIHYLYHHGWSVMELYGVDLNIWRYQGQRRYVGQAMGKEIKLINCCPSTQYEEAEVQERPWTNGIRK